LIAIVLATSAYPEEEQFVLWMRKHNKNYGSSEETVKRLVIFKENLQKIANLNNKYPRTKYAVNKFADLTAEEFKDKYLSKQTPVRDPSWPVAHPTAAQMKAIPSSFDWRDKGAVTAVKNQGQCGSCWSFYTTGNVEGQWFLAGNRLVGLSEQNLVDCDHECTMYQNQSSCDAGCDGGLQPNAYTYIIKNNGIDTEASYPYEGVDDTCRFKSQNVGAKISNWTFVSSNEDEMAAYLVANGPLAIAADAVEWQFYFGGVFYAPCGTQLDHGILIVGYGVETDILDETMPYWTVKNSWGEDWGDSGYLYIERGVGLCGLNQYVTSSIIKK